MQASTLICTDVLAQSALPTSTFKSHALPLHINITHTPPSISPTSEGKNDDSDDRVPVASTDPGFIGNLSLVPSSFSTGSYGWKGSKRITVELQNADGGLDGEKEKVQVMLTCVFFRNDHATPN